MITIFAEKPDMGTKFAAALDAVHLHNGVDVSFDDLEQYRKQIVAQRAKDGYFKIRYQGEDAYVTWGMGHLCELKQAYDYVPEYKSWSKIPLPFLPDPCGLKPIESSEKQLRLVEKIFRCSDQIICATDDDREGDLIFDCIYQYLGCKVPFQRILFSEQSKEAFVKAFEKQRLVDGKDRYPVIQAGRARSESDFLVGANLSVAMTLKYPGNNVLSVGRVQTAVLNMIVQRELDIRNFKPSNYWVLEGWFAPDCKNGYLGTHEQKRFEKEADIDALVNRIQGKPGVVSDIETKVFEKGKPYLYSLQTLQMDANKKYGFPLDKTLQLAQSLYEKGFTTYPRTDSVHLTDDMGPEMNRVITMLFRESGYQQYKIPFHINAKDRHYFDSSKVESHFAIVPTSKPPKSLSGDEAKLYDLVARSVICMVYPNAKMSKTTIKTSVDGEPFHSSGTSIKDPGFLKVLGIPKEKFLPDVKKGEVVKATVHKTAKQTEPPKRYTDATILNAMMNCGNTIEDEELKKIMAAGPNGKPRGLGRPSSQASIVSTLEKRNYTVKKGKTIYPTERGISLIQCLPVDDLKSAAMTAQWEKRLDDIEHGKDDYQSFMKDMRTSIARWMKEVSEQTSGTIVSDKASGGIAGLVCPVCGEPLRMYDWGAGCTGYQKTGCKFSIGSVAKKKLTPNQIKGLVEGKQVHVKGLTGKKGKFEADLKLVPKEQGGMEIKFIF